MSYDIQFKVEPDYLRVTALGSATLVDNLDLGKKILMACSKNDREKVLVDVRGLGEPTTITEAFELGQEVAPLALGVLKKAALLHGENRQELEKFFQTTIRNRGINLCAFLDEGKAIDWLLTNSSDCLTP
jgi:hypothetical protein